MEVNYKVIGRNIRKYRLKKGWKQKKLAETICMTEQHISHIETARTQLSLPTLIAIANALEVDCNTLLGDTIPGARMAVMHRELESVLSDIENDTDRIRLCVAICRAVKEYGA